jgi:hypothetical protein
MTRSTRTDKQLQSQLQKAAHAGRLAEKKAGARAGAKRRPPECTNI